MKLCQMILLFIVFSAVAQADDSDYFSIVAGNNGNENLPNIIAEGQIRSIDLDARTAIISGFVYYFGPSTIANAAEYKLLGRSFGSLEMMRTDMHVEIVYKIYGEHRVASNLQEIEQSEEF